MLKRTNLLLSVVLLSLSSAASTAHAAGLRLPTHAQIHPALISRQQQQPTTSDREQDGLIGPVRRVKTETAKITTKNAKPVEGPRVVLETATYDIKGGKVDNAYFLAAGGTITGREVYKYDDKGNIVEMTLHNSDGSLLTKEVYTYEFDAMGNWSKMITSVAVIEGGKMIFEPTEVTYRTISYFLDEAMMAKMAQPAAPAPNPAVAANSSSNAAAPSSTLPSSAPTQNPQTNAPASSPARTNPAAVSPAPNPAVAIADPKTAPAVSDKNESAAAASGRKLAAAPPPVASSDKTSAPAPSSLSSTTTVSGAPMVNAAGEAPARPVARGPLKPVSGGILNGKAISLPSPLYPDVAKRLHTTGTVSVEVVIDLTGKVISAKALSGPTLLQAAAERAALQARFSPTLLSGQPVRVSGQINYNFSLD